MLHCSKPVSSTNLDPGVELFRKECDEDLTILDCGYSPKEQTDKLTKKGLQKAGRDDEEEWGRIRFHKAMTRGRRYLA
jgi:hypothetical protein